MLKRKYKFKAYMIALLSFVLLTATAFGQGASATLSGSVHDTSGGAMIGATITARNVDTGVETRATTNNAGIYNMSLQAGNYIVYAEASGFQRTVREGVRLTAGSQTNLPLPMAVAGQVTEIEVIGTAESMTLEASASTGTLLQQEAIQMIPTLAPNAIASTLNVMGGVTRITVGSQTFDAVNQEIAGVSASMINVTRDGITVNEVRNQAAGITSSSNVNPEVVGEMRVIQSAVDAELGRGAGQIQITTRSGSNAYRGSAVWNIQNTALDANDFSMKLRGMNANWRNLNNYTLTVSGPIVKNKTFFFANWEQQISRDKLNMMPRVMTSCARRGIYRWLTSDEARGGWLPNVISSTNAYVVGTGYMRSVNDDGTPWGGGTVLNSSTGNTEYPVSPTTVMFESVFGQLRPDVRTALEDRSNPLGVYGNAVDGCTMMDKLGYDPMNNRFLTMTDGQNVNAWTGDFAAGGAYRYAYDPTGYIHRFIMEGADYGAGRVVMPPANFFTGQGDGLNSAAHKWSNSLVGSGASQYGTGGDPDRKGFTTRLDHNINNDHRLSGTFNLEKYYVTDGYRVWPEQYGGYSGGITRKPWALSITLNSTLAPTILNEFRFGYSRSDTWVYKPLDAKDGDNMAAVLLALAGNDASNPYYAGSWMQDKPIIVGPGEGDGGMPNSVGASNAMAYRSDNAIVFGVTDNIDRSYPYGTRGSLMSTWGGHDPRWTFSDTVTWIKGTHSFKFGFEYRKQSSFQSYDGTVTVGVGGSNTNLPVARGGVTSGAANRRRQSLINAGFGNFNGVNYLYSDSQDTAANTTGSYVLPYNMMSLLSGSLSETSLMYYAIPDPKSPNGARWNDIAAGESEYSYTVRNQELSWFFKDDWKVTSDLTLNLGVRWEYYGVPHASNGMTLGIPGGTKTAWGISEPGDFYNNGKGWVVDRTYLPGFQRDDAGNPILPDPVIRYEFIGPGSSNPDRMAWGRDMNNFAPHVGFAWQLPWFGRGMTTLRGGYSINYTTIGSHNEFPGQIVNIAAAGVNYARRYSGDGVNTNPASTSYYMDITDLKNMLPLQPAGNVFPLGVQLNDALYASGATVIDENLTNPYVHSLNMSLTRSIGRMFTVDVRYVGTFRRNPITSMNVNQNPFLDTAHFNWITELDKVRKGDESIYINSIIPHNEATGQLYYGTIRNHTGSDQMRQQQASNVARGVYNSVVSALGPENGQLPRPFGSERGLILRAGCLPKDRPGYEAAFAADPRVNVNNFPCQVGLPLNFYYAAPQFASSSIRHNTDSVNNYNSMQAQVTMRPTHGLNFQATYTWSRNLSSSSWTNYLEERDYNLSDQHRSHMMRFFGSYELPLGSKGLLLRDASSWVRKAVEGWQLNWILSMESGPPLSVTASGAGSTLYGRTWPILVRSDLWDDKQGKAKTQWADDGTYMPGTYLSRDYIQVLDTNICNPDRMSTTLYNAQCENTAGSVKIVNASAPRAVALATRDANGRSIAAVYEHDYMGDDGVMYKAGDPIIVFRNADQSDGRNASGNYKPGRMTAQGRFGFDLAMSKSIEFMEGKKFEIRVDAQNILNHATPIGPGVPGNIDSGGKYLSIDPPTLAITGAGAIGTMSGKSGHRTFQARLRLSF